MSHKALIVPFSLVLASTLACSGSDGTEGGEADDSVPANPGADDFPADMMPAELVPDLELIAPENAGDIPVFTDIVQIEPGADETYCTFSDVILEEERVFGESWGSQSPMGHHAIFQYAAEAREPGTRPCDTEDMEFSMLLGGTAGKEAGTTDNFGGQLGVRVPAGAQFVINHHWINTSEEVVDAQAMMVAREIVNPEDAYLATTMNMLAIGWEIPALGALTETTECTYEEDVRYVQGLGHMHEWGTHVSIEVDRQDGTTESFIDQEWTAEEATGNNPGRLFRVDEPFVVNQGDTVRLTCEWENTTDEAIGFPREMCIFFGFSIEASDDFICANGYWLNSAEAAEAAADYDPSAL